MPQTLQNCPGAQDAARKNVRGLNEFLLKFKFDQVSLLCTNLQWLSSVLRITANPLSLLTGSRHLLPLPLIFLPAVSLLTPELPHTGVVRASWRGHPLIPGPGLCYGFLPGYLCLLTWLPSTLSPFFSHDAVSPGKLTAG